MVQFSSVAAGWRMSDNAPTPELVALLADELAQEIRRVNGSHTLGAGALAEALAPFIIDVSTRAATVPQGVSEVRVLDRGFTFSKGVNVPTVLVGFAPEDWVSRDAYAAAIDAAMTPQQGG